MLSNDHPTDGWGTEIQGRFDDEKNVAVVFSNGLDRSAGTEDDLICVNQWSRGFEDGRQVWHRRGFWYLPEGLESALQPVLRAKGDLRDDKIE